MLQRSIHSTSVSRPQCELSVKKRSCPNISQVDVYKEGRPVPQVNELFTSVRPRLHQMTSDHNRSELGIQDHSNEQSSSKLVPKVVP
ncbi:hypothetical protein Tco_0005297 [Tanacetum coccineum]